MAEQQQIICIRCPKGCHVTLTHEGKEIVSIEGFSCPRGEDYAKNEFLAPVRMFTSSVKCEGGTMPLVACKTKTEIPKDKMIEAARESCKVTVQAPVKIGDVIVGNICGTGVDLIATRNINKAS